MQVVAADAREARATVLDRGIGIDDAEAARLFTAFYRTDTAKKRPTHGTGFALPQAEVAPD